MRLLIVEDEHTLADALRRGLSAEGYVVDVAADGPAGLDAARAGGYDAILLDVMLPGMSGYTIVKTLRAEENWVPVLMLTAKDGEIDEADGLDYGADDYLTKPFSYVVLLARLRALLRRDPPPRPVTMRVGDLELDPSSRSVLHADVELVLAPREYAVLQELMRSSPSVVPKESLIEAVWGSEGVDPNIVEVYIGHLRRKLGRERIETVRGLGYRVRS